MQERLGLLWEAARASERGNDVDRTRLAYEQIIGLDPLQPAAWLKLSQLALHEDRYRDARNAALRAAESTSLSARWRALPYVTMQLLHFDERLRVTGLIGSANWDHEAVLSQAAVLAQRLWLADAAGLALQLLDHAMRVLPPHFLLHFSRGEVLNHLGRLEEAEKDYLRCIDLEPAYPHAYLSLVRNRRSGTPGARAPAIRAALQAALVDEDRVPLGYALFHELDAAGDTAGAWQALEAAARLHRARSHHDPATARRDLDALLAAFESRTPLRHPERSPGHGRVPIFVVGLPRSGTTLLDRMLGNHPEVASAGELNAFSRSMSWVMDAYYEPPPRAGIVRLANGCDWGEVGAGYLAATAELRPDKRCLIDKNPLNIYNAGYIAQSLPEARIVCLSRNPMDACFSNMKELFAPGSYEYSYDQAELAEHYAGFQRMLEAWQRFLPDRFHVVQYESLVDDPERELKAVLAFCGLDFDPAYIDITRNQTPVSTASSTQVREPLNRRGIDAWRKYRSQLQPLAMSLARHGIEVA